MSGRVVAAFSATVALGLLSVTALNVVVNPLGYYGTNWFQPMTWQSRDEKTELMRRSAPAEVLIVGSSRTMGVAPLEIESLTQLSAFNAAVDSARVEDDYALFRYAVEALHWKPKELVLGVDLEAFHNALGPDSRLLSCAALMTKLPSEMKWAARIVAAEDVLSQGQLISSLSSLYRSVRGSKPPERKKVFDANGYVHYPARERSIAAGTFSPDIVGSFAEYDGRFAGFTALDAPRMRLFDELMTLAEKNGVRVRAFITPLHPRLLARLRERRDFDRLHGLLREFMRQMTDKHPGLSVADFTEVASFHGDPELFFDGAHTRDENMTLLVHSLYAVQ